MAEQGFAEAQVTPWFGVVVPAGTPQPVVDRSAGSTLPGSAGRLIQSGAAHGVEVTATKSSDGWAASAPVSDCATLRNSRCAPLANTSSSRFSAV